MRNLMTLYTAEIKKILCKRAVWIAMAIGVAFVMVVSLSNLSADGRGVYVRYQETKLTELSGQAVDQAFFDRFHNEINTEVSEHGERYENIIKYDPDAVPLNAAANLGKQALYDYIYDVVRDRGKVMTVTEEEFYNKMRDNIVGDGMELGSSEGEINTWLESFDRVKKPLAYTYAQSYQNIVDFLFMVGWILFLNIAVALSGVFADEKTFRTDTMILSAKNGRLPVCAAKLLAGITVMLLQTALLVGICFGAMFAFYGISGWNAVIQIIIPSSPWNITVGKMLLIYFALAVVTGLLFAVTDMALSYFTRSAVAVMAIQAAVLFTGLFNVPSKLGFVSKLWQIRPTMLLHYGTFCNTYMYGKFNCVEISLILCIGIAFLLTAGLILSYRKSQVESR